MKQVILMIQSLLFLMILLGCNNSTGPEDTSPLLSNLVIPQNLALTCYTYSNRFVTTRNDSITISFDYNSKKVSTIDLDGTIDSGKNWFQIAKINAGSSNHADYIWSPIDSSIAALKFCGEKKCVLRISTSFDTLKSGEFYIIGSLPASLIKPAKNDHYSSTDSLPVEFICNYDLLSDIDISFFGNDVKNKVQFSEDSARVIKTEGINTNLKSFVYFFPLQRYSAQLSEMGSPVSIMISDYSVSGFYQIVTPVVIENITDPKDSISLTNLVIPQNLALTCYPYQNRFITSRNDSMTISFDYNSKKVSTIDLDGTIDSGKSWFKIAKITTGSANHADYSWSPVDSSIAALKFCGEKKCVLRVSTSFDTLKTGEFYIIGSLPASLIKPAQNDHYSSTDSLPVEFICNFDLLSDIDISFFGNDIENKVQFSEDSARVIKTEGINTNLKSFVYFFPLQRYSAQLSDMGSPVSIMISDYSVSGFYQIVTPITIDTP